MNTGFHIQQRLSGTRARAQKPPNSSAAASSSRPPVPLSAWMHTSLLKPSSCSRRTLSSQPAGRPPPPPLGAAAEGGCAAPAVGAGAGAAGEGAADKRHGCGQQEGSGSPSEQEFGSPGLHRALARLQHPPPAAPAAAQLARTAGAHVCPPRYATHLLRQRARAGPVPPRAPAAPSAGSHALAGRAAPRRWTQSAARCRAGRCSTAGEGSEWGPGRRRAG